MKWAVVLIFVVGGIIHVNIAAKIVKPNHGWLRQIEGRTNNRQSDNCPDTCKCGVRNTKRRIIGGHQTTTAEHPWMVYVQSETENATYSCGGSLMTDRHVVTAAHCIMAEAANTTAMMGVWNWNNLDNIIIKAVKEIIIHPQYNPKIHKGNDIALIELVSPMKFDGDIVPLCMPTDQSATYIGVNASSSGWGLTDGKNLTSSPDELMEVFVTVVDGSNCRRQFGSSRYKPDIMMCAGTSDGKLGTCSGDSGGPLESWTMAPDGTEFNELIGVVSFGRKLCDTHSVYASAPAYIDWMNQHIDTTGACKCGRP